MNAEISSPFDDVDGDGVAEDENAGCDRRRAYPAKEADSPFAGEAEL